VLLVIAQDPASRLRDIAAACHITERTALSIVTELRHPAEAHVPVEELLELFTPHDSQH
jgi:hypothetical protein